MSLSEQNNEDRWEHGNAEKTDHPGLDSPGLVHW